MIRIKSNLSIAVEPSSRSSSSSTVSNTFQEKDIAEIESYNEEKIKEDVYDYKTDPSNPMVPYNLNKKINSADGIM